ncbi:MAG: hypothetical protein QF437_00760 [Planctomycetota bacterium]|nr:hypothetical protein [Planctomycetota bacterium]MDP7128988.1 hypothetical protein [Planctomycetota bacterium]
MNRFITSTLAALQFCAFSWAGALRLDYLPVLVYHDDVIHIHLTVKEALKERDSLKLEGTTAQNKVLWSREVKPDTKGEIQISLAPEGREHLKASLLQLMRDGKAVESLKFPLISSMEITPPLKAAGSYLYDEDGNRCILIVEHRIKGHGRHWLPVRIVKDWLVKKDPPPRAVMFSDMQLDASESQNVEFVLSKEGSSPSRPIYETVAAMSRFKGVKKDTAFTFFAGTRDVQLGTAPRDFRIGLEFMVQQLQKHDAKDIRIVLPIGSSEYSERLEYYRLQCEAVAAIYRLKNVLKLERGFATPLFREAMFDSTLRRLPSKEVMTQLTKMLTEDSMKPY